MMRIFSRADSGLLVAVALALGSCSEDAPGPGTNVGGSGAGSGGSGAIAGSNASGAGGAAGTASGGSGISGGVGGSASGGGGAAGSAGASGNAGTAGSGGAPASVCGDALFCEQFDDYAAVTNLTNNQEFGPWRAALKAGATMTLDGTHTKSGASALHVHIDDTVNSGGRLFADGAEPLFANTPTHVYGRMMMYIEANGTSVHWTFFGVSGDAEPGSPVAGRNASYIMSSLPRQGVNTYSFVYGLDGTDGYHDCSSQSMTNMPSAWACIAFEIDSVARKLRMYKDAAPDPILSVDDHGKGCVPPTDVNEPWYGPAIDQIFVGAWSFHPMNDPLDVWIDDLVVDTKPVACPVQ
jgi:hypothetical protein